MKVLVCGGRDFEDKKLLYTELDKLELRPIVDMVIHGGARGADTMAEVWSFHRNIPCLRFPADWKQGKVAGIVRNNRMLTIFPELPDLVVAFPGGRGTAHMVAIAKKDGVPVLELKPTS